MEDTNNRTASEAYAETHKTELQDDDIVYGIKRPRSGCSHCYGEGRKAWDLNGNPILCHCMSRANGEWITWGEFQAITQRTLQIVQGLENEDEMVNTDAETLDQEALDEVLSGQSTEVDGDD